MGEDFKEREHTARHETSELYIQGLQNSVSEWQIGESGCY